MATSSDPALEQAYPGLAGTHYEKTSPRDPKYNCIAWALGDQSRWWEPDPMELGYWPDDVPRNYSVEAYQRLFQSLGFRQTSSFRFVAGVTRVSLFQKDGKATHASRQLNGQIWTSKLGFGIDISHNLRALAGPRYGDIAIVFEKKGAALAQAPT